MKNYIVKSKPLSAIYIDSKEVPNTILFEIKDNCGIFNELDLSFFVFVNELENTAFTENTLNFVNFILNNNNCIEVIYFK